jgi:hypothetical protein
MQLYSLKSRRTRRATLEAAKLVLAFIATRDRRSATNTEVLLASTAREGSLAIKAEWLIALIYQNICCLHRTRFVALSTVEQSMRLA